MVVVLDLQQPQSAQAFRGLLPKNEIITNFPKLTSSVLSHATKGTIRPLYYARNSRQEIITRMSIATSGSRIGSGYIAA